MKTQDSGLRKWWIGIDNGVSGSIAILDNCGQHIFQKIPTKKELNYTKTKQYITRIDTGKLECIIIDNCYNFDNSIVLLERPMVNPTRFKATTSALRSLEATLIVLERLGLPFQYIDSKQWQKALLPKGLKGTDLKSASWDIGNRLFPQFNTVKHPDRDGLLIAEYCRRNF